MQIALQIECLLGKKFLDPDSNLDLYLDNFASYKRSIRWYRVLWVMLAPLLLLRLQGDGVHDEGDELGHVGAHVLLIQLVHEHHDDGQLRQNLQRQHRLRDQVILE